LDAAANDMLNGAASSPSADIYLPCDQAHKQGR
jgi:hypothetical protein